MKLNIPTQMPGIFAAGLALCLAGQAAAMNVVEKLASKPEFSTLVTAVTEAGLVDTLARAEEVTIFAPSNSAFAKIPASKLDALLADKAALTRVLTYHVAPESIRFSQFKDGPQETFLTGETVDVEVKSYFFGYFRQVKVDGVTITQANITADNGVIHRIEEVLDPGSMPLPSIWEIANGNPDFSILASLVQQAGFARPLGSDYYNLTVFAPTNAAFEALGQETLDAVQGDVRLLRTILKNHIASGSLDSEALGSAGSVNTLLGLTLEVGPNATSATGLGVDGKPIDAANIPASNGIVHVVGEVLVPPAPQSLVDVASTRDDLTTFVTALGAADLADTFDSTAKWPAYTVFAPNNSAFASLPDGVLGDLLADPTGALAEVLKRHVVSGRLEAARLYDGQILHTLSGERLKVSIADGEVRINNALVADPDLRAENGIIHVMGDVIADDTYTIADFVDSKSYLSTLNAALEAATLKGALDNPDAKLTLFAPINYAFGKLPEGTVETLLADPFGDLTQILLYHVVDESLDSGKLIDDGSATTLQGADVEITSRTFRLWGWRIPYSIVSVNGNRVISADIKTDNGIVHLISGVLLPPSGE